MVVLSPKEEKSPVDEDDCDEEVGDVSYLMSGRDVSKGELVESGEPSSGSDSTNISSASCAF